jgi:hypothetical protein
MQVEAAPTAAIGTDRCDLSQGSGSSLRPSKAVHRNLTQECDREPGASFPEASECHGRLCPALSVAPAPARRSSSGLRAAASRTTQRHLRPTRCPTTCHQAICPRSHKLLRPDVSRVPVPIQVRDLRGHTTKASSPERRGYTVTALDVASSAHVPPVHASQLTVRPPDTATWRPAICQRPLCNISQAAWHVKAPGPGRPGRSRAALLDGWPPGR